MRSPVVANGYSGRMRILVLAEDADRLYKAFNDGGCEVTAKGCTGEAEHLLLCEQFDVIVFHPRSDDPYFLSRMLRDYPGRALVVWLRSSSSSRVGDLLDAGADEVLDGTMDDRELLARVRNAARHGRHPASQTLEHGDLKIISPSGKASWRDELLPLSKRERGVLLALAEATGETVAREVIYRKVWGYSMVRGDRSVDVNVKRLRNKLAQAGVELRVRTTPGVGYRLILQAAKPDETPVAIL